MKKTYLAAVLASGIIGLLLTKLAFASPAGKDASSYTVHEWGTFTDVQGGDGRLLSWRPLQTSELPGFVRNWQNAGMNRRFADIDGKPFIGKGGMVTLQRLETPVMYFYSAQAMKVDVKVNFPGGLITEWYPQATQMGPSVPLDPNASPDATLPERGAVWKQLQLLPESAEVGQLQSYLPPEESGRHYFAARKTSADTVRMEFAGRTNEPDNYEKFIFYRGAGSFETPLNVSIDAQNEVVVKNTGDQALSHLFLLVIKNDRGGFEEIESLSPGESKTLPTFEQENSPVIRFDSIADGQAKLGTAVHTALVGAGLFDDEAAAMVNTWKDSWFAEDGVRVLYLLPRDWTDKTLPLTLNPRPQKVVRVMVGRAELITPGTVADLAAVLAKAEAGDVDARHQAVDTLTRLGRFAEPALELAVRGETSQQKIVYGYQLLSQVTQQKSKSVGN
ncbi:MAG TPA: hypothetical protein VGN23_17125 [Verrucomicrobiae bacterium]|jgi:hypothetical protein